MRTPVALVALTCLAALTAGCATSSAPDGTAGTATGPAAALGPAAAVRVDLVGYLPAEPKTAHLMAAARPTPPRFTVVSTNGQVVLSGQAGPSTGGWNDRYQAVFPLDLSALRTPGGYHVEVPALKVRSPEFRVGSPTELLRSPVLDTVTFYQAQRDGQQVVPAVLGRQAAHRNDSRAHEHTWPRFTTSTSDVIADPTLRRVDGDPMDLEGGWADAGGTVKLTSTTAYTTTLLLAAQRDLGAAAPPALRAEAGVGLAWLRKAWQVAADDERLPVQVGIVRGDAGRTFIGDRDLWRLPERDDALAGPRHRYLAHRPVFTTDARPGRLSPALAGRLAASFALAAQLHAGSDPDQAQEELELAAEVLDRARTEGVGEQDLLVTAPRSLDPDSTWRDDLQLGAAALARAAIALDDPRADRWVRAASRWAEQYVEHEAPAEHTFGERDLSALAHAELATALLPDRRDDASATGASTTSPASPATTVTAPVGTRDARTWELVVGDLQRQLDLGVAQGRKDRFGVGAAATQPDVAARALGLVTSARLLQQLTGSTRYDAFASAQRHWVLGANPWGTSWVVGVGSSSPRCPHHRVANLAPSASSTGTPAGPAPMRGAVVNGPVGAAVLGGGLPDYPVDSRICPPGGGRPHAPFDGQGSVFVDDVRAWQTVEPSIARTASATLALALTSRQP